jgi:hypothetical protein
MRERKFRDFYHGDGWFVSGRHWLLAVRWRWHFYFIRPPGKPGYKRIYFGPFELEIRP